jgi:hypothetical protein
MAPSTAALAKSAAAWPSPGANAIRGTFFDCNVRAAMAEALRISAGVNSSALPPPTTRSRFARRPAGRYSSAVSRAFSSFSQPAVAASTAASGAPSKERTASASVSTSSNGPVFRSTSIGSPHLTAFGSGKQGTLYLKPV